MKYFEDITVGDEYTDDATYEVTEAEIREVGERWDPQPFHIDPVAAKSSLFGGLVASSVLLHAILFALGNSPDKEPFAALTILGFDNIHVRAPARPGHVLTLRDTVLECRASNSRPELGIVRSLGELINQDGEVVYSCEGTYLIKTKSLTPDELTLHDAIPAVRASQTLARGTVGEDGDSGLARLPLVGPVPPDVPPA